MRGVETHISDPKSNTTYTTALKNNPEILEYDLSRPMIPVIYV